VETVKANRGYPTLHPEVNEIIEQVLKNAEAILQSNFLAVDLQTAGRHNDGRSSARSTDDPAAALE
jgi:hypothetical protein